MSSRGDEGGGAGGGLAAWLRSLELDEYIDAFREAGYTSLRFVQMADINDIVGDVHMKRPHVRVFTPAWTELVEASTISERSSARTPEPPAESIGAALSARAERLASLASDEPVDGEGNDERAPLVVGQPSRPIQIAPSPIRSPAEFRAEITSRLTGEVNAAVQNATANLPSADPNTPQFDGVPLRAISSTIRSILAFNAAGQTRSPPTSPRQLELEPKPEPEPESAPEPEPELQQVKLTSVAKWEQLSEEQKRAVVVEAGFREPKLFRAGESIIVEGDEGGVYYYLQSGEAVVSVSGLGEIERKHAGDGFGEHALLWNTPRNATVQAVTDCECLELNLEEYEMVTKQFGKAAKLEVNITSQDQSLPDKEPHDSVASSTTVSSSPASPGPAREKLSTPAPTKPERTISFSLRRTQSEDHMQAAANARVRMPTASLMPLKSPSTAKEKWARLKATTGITGGVASSFKAAGTRIADIHKGWDIEHGFVMFTGAKMDRTIRNAKAQSAIQAQQGAFLKISGDPTLGTAFNSLPTLLDRQRRIRQLKAVLETFEQEWGLHMPPMIVSVTGNALPFAMRPKFHTIFAQALLKATQATGAWVTTGGTDAGVMKLVGDAMKHSNTPVLGVSTWGVIKGRQRLSRPSQADIRERIIDQIKDKNDRAPVDEVKNVGTSDEVTRHYARYKAKSWADPQSLPVDVGTRTTFIEKNSMATLDELGLISHEGRPDLTLGYPYLRTGKVGRGQLGRWGPNHAIDTIVTRRPPKEGGHKKAKDEKEQAMESDGGNAARQSSSGLQVALAFRPEDQVWAIPGKFINFEDVMIMSHVEQGQRLTGELPPQESDDPIDRARMAVRKVFELEGVSDNYSEFSEMFDDIFKKSWQTLVYRGYSDDPRNTNEAWVETSAWHLHCPVELVEQLEKGYSQVSEQVMWMDVVVTGPRLEFQDEFGNKYDLFASHRELIELAVFGNVLGNHDMPFEYDGLSRDKGKSAPDEIVHLNPNHSHYICVDDGSVGKFGVELNFRVEFETFMSCFDHTARRMGIAQLTQHFTACMDESALHIAGQVAQSGKRSHPIDISPDYNPNIVPVVRTASDGKTKMEYTVKIIPSDSINPVTSEHGKDEGRSTPDPSELKDADDPHLPSQFSLKGEDVVGIKVSDGDINFFPTVPFDPLVTQYEVVVPRPTKEVTVTATLMAAAPKDIKRTVPIVVLCYGGGPFTIHTLASSGEKPIIVVSGSQRAAQYIEDWCSFETQKANKRNDPEMVLRLSELQKEQARRSLRMDFAGAKKTTYEAVAEAAEKPDWWNVESFLHALSKLGDHDYMHFFQINQAVTGKTSKKIRLNPMLPPLLDSIVKSAQVKQEVKLPLAIRLNHEDDVKILCDAHGIARNQSFSDEITLDSRLLIFAAFNDQGKVVDRLLDTGFALHNLDSLVALEIQRELDRPKLIKEDEPPAYWIAEHFSAAQYVDQEELATMVATRWRKVESKDKVYRAISWNMMPTLPGWLMNIEQTDPEIWWPAGTMVQQLSSSFLADEYPPNGLMKREFVIVSPASFAGTRMIGEDSGPEDGGVLSVTFLGVTRQQRDGVSADVPPQDVRTKLQPLYRDNVTEWLPLNSECKYRLPANRMVSFKERQRVASAFANWLGRDEGLHSNVKDPNLCMHDLHRIYWAIRSNRPRLARVLMTRCSHPILAGLFSAQIYRDQKLPADYVPDVNLKPMYLPKAMRASSESYACEILDNAEFDGSNSAFDSFIFYGIDEEDTDDYLNFVVKENDKIENTKLREVLQLMGVDERTEVTNIDLALLANSKTFMTQNGVMQFLMKLWTRPSDNGNWVQRTLPDALQIARVKMLINLFAFAAFLAMYVFLLRGIPPRGEEYKLTEFEMVFWGWAFAFALNEAVEARGDYDTFYDYVRGSGNAIDLLVIFTFLVSLASRAYSLFQYNEEPYSLQIRTVNVPVMLSTVDFAYGALCLNFVVCCFRFLMLLSMFERIGVMVIIVGKIFAHDILPFVVFAGTCIAAFETAAMFFAWMAGRPQAISGHFFEVFSGIGQDDLADDQFFGNPNVPEWDRTVGPVEWMATVVQLAFFMLAIVILMNLLIAMMADTYTSVIANAVAEYQMQFAKIVKEGYETTVFPVPLNVLEHLVNRIAGDSEQKDGKTTLNWGTHYTWPASALPYQLEMAMRKVLVKKEAEKAAKQARMAGSTRA